MSGTPAQGASAHAAPVASVDGAARGAALVGLLFLAGQLVPSSPVASRVVRLEGVPAPGWYEADSLAEAARAAGAEPPSLAPRPLVDGDVVRLSDGWALPVETPGAVSTRVFGGRTSLNRASMDELEALPGIGPALAARIIAGRPYRSVAALDRVKGIGPKRLAALRPLVQP